MTRNRYLDKGGGVVGVDDLDTCRKIGLQIGKLGSHSFGRIQGIGAGGQHNSHAGGRFTVEGCH
jgi:hypothetical protein